MSNIIALVGATGGQGGFVIQALLSSLSSYTIRGITRNPNSTTAQSLASKGVSLITADLNDETSLLGAFSGATAIFAVTDFYEPFQHGGPKHAMDVEYLQGTNMARAALQTPTLKHFIWSTLVDSEKISAGKHTVPHFQQQSPDR